MQDTASLPVRLFLVVLHRIRIYISRYQFYNFLEPNLIHPIQPNPSFNGFTHPTNKDQQIYSKMLRMICKKEV